MNDAIAEADPLSQRQAKGADVASRACTSSDREAEHRAPVQQPGQQDCACVPIAGSPDPQVIHRLSSGDRVKDRLAPVVAICVMRRRLPVQQDMRGAEMRAAHSKMLLYKGPERRGCREGEEIAGCTKQDERPKGEQERDFDRKVDECVHWITRMGLCVCVSHAVSLGAHELMARMGCKRRSSRFRRKLRCAYSVAGTVAQVLQILRSQRRRIVRSLSSCRRSFHWTEPPDDQRHRRHTRHTHIRRHTLTESDCCIAWATLDSSPASASELVYISQPLTSSPHMHACSRQSLSSRVSIFRTKNSAAGSSSARHDIIYVFTLRHQDEE